MGKLKNFDRAMYRDTYEAIFSLMEEGLHSCHRDNGYVKIYTQDALDMVLGFLCVNNIPHSYRIQELDHGFGTGEIKSIVSIQWFDEDGDRGCVFFSDIETGKEEENEM